VFKQEPWAQVRETPRDCRNRAVPSHRAANPRPNRARTPMPWLRISDASASPPIEAPLARDARGWTARHGIAGSGVVEVLAPLQQALEPLRSPGADLGVVATVVVLADRAEHDRRRQIAVERLLDPDQVFREKATQHVGDLEMVLPHPVPVETPAAVSAHD
jgi:hypothetical protein